MLKTIIMAVILLHLLIMIQLSHSTEKEFHIQTKCMLNDSECLTMQAQGTLQEFVKGIPEFGITSIKQLYVGAANAIVPNYNYQWNDMKVTGLENIVFDEVSIDMDLKIMRLLFHTSVVMDFYYEGEGILFSTLSTFGKGRGNITLNNMTMEILFIFDIVKDNNGKDYMDLKTYYYGLDADGGIVYYFDNVYNGDKKKSEIVHQLINKSWRTVVANFGFFNRKMTDKIFDVCKLFMRSSALEDLAIY